MAVLIPNRHGEVISKFGAKQRLGCVVSKPSQTGPSLKNRLI
nr:hypothetical protein [uncultured Glaciecola sp.]